MSLAKSLAQPLVAAALLITAVPAFARQTKKVDVYYQSFHDFYSCSGAEDDVRSILSQLGAQKIQTKLQRRFA